MRSERLCTAGPLCAFLLTALVLPFASGLSSADTRQAFPAASVGDLHFDLDYTAYHRDPANAHVEFHVRIANSELKFFPIDAGGYEAEVRVIVDAVSADKKKTTYSRRLSILANSADMAASRDQAQLLTAPLALAPGEYDIDFTLQDMHAQKRGLLDAIRKRQRSGTAAARMSIAAPPQDGELRASSLQFAWLVIPSNDADTPPRIVSNPPRVYGLYASTLHAYVEVYDRIDTTGATYRIDSSIVTGAGDTTWAASDTTAALRPAFGHFVHADVSSLPAGHYVLGVRVTRADGRGVAATSGGFDVLWQDASWGALDQDQLDVARFLLAEQEYDRFRALRPGEREKYLSDFWQQNDPTPETAFNERRAEFERRLRFANTHYSALGRGFLSDRGRIYIRLGEPDDINRHTQPINRETIHEELAQTRGGQELLRNDVPAQLETERNRPFEVWTYDRGGHPLFEDAVGGQSTGQGLTFVFVDEQGWGDYILRFTTERTKY